MDDWDKMMFMTPMTNLVTPQNFESNSLHAQCSCTSHCSFIQVQMCTKDLLSFGITMVSHSPSGRIAPAADTKPQSTPPAA